MPRQRLYRASAVVLKRMDLGEADRILTLYTAEHGKVRAIAKGVRRTTSRSAGHLELFTQIDALLATGRELDVITQADTVTSFRKVREDLLLTSQGYHLVEVTDLLTADRLENAAVFTALVEALHGLEEKDDPRVVALAYLIRLFDALGFRPELMQCVNCRADIGPGRNAFASRLGGVLCPSCSAREGSSRPIADTPLKLLRNLQRTDGRAHPSVPEPVVREAEGVLRDYAESIVERELRTPAFLARVRESLAETGV